MDNNIFHFASALRKKHLILTSLSVFLFIAFFVNRDFIGSDGRSFQRMAVNIAEGNGFSVNIDPPYEKQFFREPGYPAFFSVACSINNLIGNKNAHLSYREIRPGYVETSHPEILILRILQALSACLIIILFYEILLFFLNPRLAIGISFLLIFYLPFTIFITYPQREIMVTALLSALGYFFLKSAFSEKSVKYDIYFGLCAAALVLTLQAYIFILPLFLLSHLVITKSIRKTALSSAIISIIVLLCVLPWTLRGYSEARNIKVIKTFGIAYTYEFRKFHDVYAKAYMADFEGKSDTFSRKIVNEYSLPGRIIFEKSFNGYYVHAADSLARVMDSAGSTSSEKLKRMLGQVLKVNFRKALVWPLWETNYRLNFSTQFHEKKAVMSISLLFGIIILISAMIGMVLFIRRIWQFIPVFIFHFFMIPFMADEGRRVLPFLPFYFMFSVLALVFIINTIKRDRFPGKRTFDEVYLK